MMAYIFQFILLISAILLTSCESRPSSNIDELTLGDLLIRPAVQHKQVSAEISEVDFVYEVLNQGPKPIEILKLDADCACIKETVSNRVIQPGAIAKITATYTTDKLHGVAEKTLQVYTNHPQAKEILLNIKLEVEPIYTLSSNRHKWSVGEQPKGAITELVVTRDKPIHLLKVESSRPEFSTSFKEIVKGRRYQIEVTPVSTAEFMLGFVRLHTDCEIKSRANRLLYVTISD